MSTGKADNIGLNTGTKPEKPREKYDQLNDQMGSLITETNEYSNRIAMKSELDQFITYQAFNASTDGVWAIDRNRKILRVNKKLLQLLGREVSQVIGRFCSEAFQEACPLEDTCPWKSIEKGESVVEQERSMMLPSGKHGIFRVTFTPLSNLEGQMIGLVETFSDITEIRDAEKALQRANQELEVLATEDGLTKIANRRRFDEFLETEWRRQKRNGNPISLVMADVDYFKNYNDTYGHRAGDDCLRKVADVMKDSIHRAGDVCARYGGDEFVVVMPETNLDGARHVVDRIRSKLREIRIPHEQSEAALHVTVSFGVSSIVPGNSLGPEVLVEIADKRLYLAKQQGRNCVVFD